ncbi:MAG: hypothetical protein LBH95_02500 [Oscillospiraceae bacterium]|jgi:predicted aspartyl protease|nr:hypothetical protein [Oscillospiraceae bacterium]
MSMFRVSVTARNPARRELVSQPVSLLVDTGAELSWLPAGMLREAGIEPEGMRVFTLASGQRLERRTGYAILHAEGFTTIDEVTFAGDGDINLLGVRTIEGFGVLVDNIGHRLVAMPTRGT